MHMSFSRTVASISVRVSIVKKTTTLKWKRKEIHVYGNKYLSLNTCSNFVLNGCLVAKGGKLSGANCSTKIWKATVNVDGGDLAIQRGERQVADGWFIAEGGAYVHL